MRIKKFLTMTMVTIMVAGLTACGGSEGSTNETTTTPVASEENSTTSTVETREAGCYDADGNLVVTWDEFAEKGTSVLNDTIKEIVYKEGLTELPSNTVVVGSPFYFTSITLPSTLTKIPYQMIGIDEPYNEFTLNFTGTMEQWENIPGKSDSMNNYLAELKVNCSDGAIAGNKEIVKEPETTTSQDTTEDEYPSLTYGEIYNLVTDAINNPEKHEGVKEAWDKGFFSDSYELTECRICWEGYKFGLLEIFVFLDDSNLLCFNLEYTDGAWSMTGVGGWTLDEITSGGYDISTKISFDAEKESIEVNYEK